MYAHSQRGGCRNCGAETRQCGDVYDITIPSFAGALEGLSGKSRLYFLDKNDALFKNGEKLIDDHTLVALTIMIAESNPEEKEMMISVIMNCIK